MTDWNALWRDAGHRFNCWPNEELVRWASTLDRGSRVLEVGCGNGANLRALLSAGFDAVGVDLAEEALLASTGLGVGSQTILSSACELPFPDSSFDAVCDIQCFQHLAQKDLVTVYREAARVLQPEGRFFEVFLVKGQENFPDLDFCEFTWTPVRMAGFSVTQDDFYYLDRRPPRRDSRRRHYRYVVIDARLDSESTLTR